jgi:hypothetical protein
MSDTAGAGESERRIVDTLAATLRYGCRKASLLYRYRGLGLIELLAPAEFFPGEPLRTRADVVEQALREACSMLPDERQNPALTLLGLGSRYVADLKIRRELASTEDTGKGDADAFRKNSRRLHALRKLG